MNIFRPAWWLPGPHLQTSWAALTRPAGLVRYRREAIALPDGDELVLDHVDGAGPRLLLLHGLEGSSYAVYVQGMAARATERGWAVTAINFRSCARDPSAPDRNLPNRLPRLYHAGDTADLDHVVELMHAREPSRTLFAAGVSLGGNALLKWLGERGASARIQAAATISVTYDLAACAENLSRGVSRMYAAVFLRRLREKLTDLVARFPETHQLVNVERGLAARNFLEFDAAVTAPLHAFTSGADYYERSSSLPYLERIARPTLAINAADDPFQPLRALEDARRRAARGVRVEIAHTGGHAAFVQGARPGATSSWAEEQAIRWLADQKFS